jgi:cell wall-associated NlpC family hydrolase
MKRRLPLLFFVCLLVALAGCAVKKVRVYEGEGPPQKGDAIVQYAASLLGRPYKSAGKGPDSFDCSGFVYYVYRRFDITVPYTTEELTRAGSQVPRENVLAGDLVIFNIKKSYHVGIMMNQSEFVHASSTKGVAVSNIDSFYWRRGLSQFRRVL